MVTKVTKEVSIALTLVSFQDRTRTYLKLASHYSDEHSYKCVYLEEHTNLCSHGNR